MLNFIKVVCKLAKADIFSLIVLHKNRLVCMQPKSRAALNRIISSEETNTMEEANQYFRTLFKAFSGQ